ncbi:UNVERIFIED_CONTAM: hypothetical protein FKN15_045417 [Acipenser sinensis]
MKTFVESESCSDCMTCPAGDATSNGLASDSKSTMRMQPHAYQAFLQFFGDEFLRLLLVRFVFCSATMRLHKVFRETRNYPETYPQLPKEETVENPMVQKHVLELASILDVQNLFCDNTLDDY